MAGKRFQVTRVRPEAGGLITDYVVAWDFNILNGGVLVFNKQNRTVAYRDWISVKEES